MTQEITANAVKFELILYFPTFINCELTTCDTSA